MKTGRLVGLLSAIGGGPADGVEVDGVDVVGDCVVCIAGDCAGVPGIPLGSEVGLSPLLPVGTFTEVVG